MVGRSVEPAVTGRTVGVEEEFILVGAHTHEPSAIGPQVVVEAADVGVKGEFKQQQVEIASSPAATLDDLARDLARLRHRVADAAATLDAVVVASGTWPGLHDPTSTDSARFARIGHEFGELARQQLTCGTHVHVSVRSADEGIVVLDRIRPWLSLLTALTANSPFWQGRDTGCASWRSVVLSQLPTAGPTPLWGDLATYRRTVQEVVDAGGAFDEAMLYYDARLSARYPTVEFRVTDVCPDGEAAIALAGLCRALVDTAVGAGDVPAPDVSTLTLRAAAWRAARHGLAGELVDPVTGALVPAPRAVGALLSFIEEALEENGDRDRVHAFVAGTLAAGTAAERQRRVVDPAAPAKTMASFRVR